MSLSGSKGASCVGDVVVITWLKPIREARGDVFWRNYSFPPNVWVSFPSSRPQFIACTKEDGGGMNFIY